MTTKSLRGTLLSIAPAKEVVGIFLLLNIFAWLVVRALQKWMPSNKAIRAASPDLEKPASRGKVTREPGSRYPVLHIPMSILTRAKEWLASDFKTPTASPYPNWDVDTSKPIPYRPFRYGPLVIHFVVYNSASNVKQKVLRDVRS